MIASSRETTRDCAGRSPRIRPINANVRIRFPRAKLSRPVEIVELPASSCSSPDYRELFIPSTVDCVGCTAQLATNPTQRRQFMTRWVIGLTAMTVLACSPALADSNGAVTGAIVGGPVGAVVGGVGGAAIGNTVTGHHRYYHHPYAYYHHRPDYYR